MEKGPKTVGFCDEGAPVKIPGRAAWPDVDGELVALTPARPADISVKRGGSAERRREGVDQSVPMDRIGGGFEPVLRGAPKKEIDIVGNTEGLPGGAFSVLEEVYEEDVGVPPARPRVTRGAGGKALRRLAAELRNWYKTRRDRLPDEPPEYAHQSQTAEDIKICIYDFCDPSIGGETSCPVPKVKFYPYARSAFWDQIALSRLRFQGSKRLYAVCRASHKQRRRRVLVLHPPEHTRADDKASGFDPVHAGRQASYHDSKRGVMDSGLRANIEELAALGASEEDLHRLLHGHDISLREWPRQYHGRHYGGALEHPDKLQQEHERMASRDFVEGPLLYTPWVVQSLGGVWKPEKDKWRTIVDATSSGVNPASVPLGVKYDMVTDAIAEMTPGCLVSGFDLTDAFLNWPYTQHHSDLMGYRDALNNYHRFRFMGFGACQSPYWQQKWGNLLKKILNTHGLKYCTGAAADYSTFRCVMCFVDDFACTHTGAASDPAIARQQYDSVLRVLADIGLEEKASKRSYPDTRIELLGFVINTVEQTVSITENRRDKLLAQIDTFLSTPAADVGRREVASLIGGLQWVAQIIEGGQLHLRRAYQARDAFTSDVSALSLKGKWGRGIRVFNTNGLQADLGWWRDALPLAAGKPIYLSNLSMVNGFWKGALPDSDESIDQRGGFADEEIHVFTTDASGFAGGAWFGDLREAWTFGADVRSPARSSNYRELLTAILSLEKWGHLVAGQRVLVRTDNTTTVKVFNTGDSSSPNLYGLARRLFDVVKKYDLKVAARHIPGLKNTLADGLSRWHYDQRDVNDWQIRSDVFDHARNWAVQRWGTDFAVDAFADPTGRNALCPVYYSAVDSFLKHDVAGKCIWGNPPFDKLQDIFSHFKACASTAPHTTSGVFVVPERTTERWWRCLKGFRVLRRFPAHTQLFTRPVLQADGPALEREFARPAKWPVLLIYWDPACRDASRGGAGICADDLADSPRGDALLRLQLSGDGAQDRERLRQLPSCPL